MSTGAPTLRERIGVDLGGRRRLEDGLAWAAAHGVHYVDMCLEGAPDHPNAPAAWTAERVAAIRTTCERHRIHLGLHSASALAERAGARLLLENLNREPEHAEVRYLAHNLEECREYFGRIQSPNLGWAFTVNHAHLVPEGIDGFLDAMDLGRCGEVRLADSHGRYEEHLRPGEGSIDFTRMFSRIEGGGYRGHYMMAFGALDDMLKGREALVRSGGLGS